MPCRHLESRHSAFSPLFCLIVMIQHVIIHFSDFSIIHHAFFNEKSDVVAFLLF